MRTASFRSIILLTLASFAFGTFEREAASAVQAPPGGFSRTALAPSDVTLFLDIEGAAGVRRELADRPIARWITSTLARGDAGRTWSDLARSVRLSESRLFDLCFGRRATLLVRGDEPAQWTIVTEIAPETASSLLRRLRATSLGPRHGGAGWEIPEHDLLLLQRGSTLLIGSRSQSSLLYDVASRLADRAVPGLAQSTALAAAKELPPGQVSLYMRHAPPLGGWSLLTAHVEGDHLGMRQIARFDAAPFTRDLTEIEIDLGALDAFEGRSLLAIIEPSDTGRSQFETFTLAALGEGLVSPDMRRNMAGRRLLVVGEVEGRGEPEPFDLQAPTLALCMELRDSAIAEAQLDRQMLALLTRIDKAGEGRFCLSIPTEDAFVPDAPRRVDLSPAGKWVSGGLQLAKPLSLTWRIARGEGAAWYVIATHPQQLEETVRVLETGGRPGRTASPPSRFANIHHSGIADGPRISHHLRSWSDGAELLAEGEHAADLRQTIEMMSDLTAGIERCRWHVRRPTRHEMDLEITIKLAPPDSTRLTPAGSE